jgi:GT2 family glycosyltransferase
VICYVLPTRDRPAILQATLDALGALPPHDAGLIVLDNASREPVTLPSTLMNGIECRCVRLDANHGAAARNIGARMAGECWPNVDWIVMLDDDSAPRDLGHLDALRDAAPDVAAIAAEIFLPRMGTREAGGLPEVFIGCGVALRRAAMLDAGGYDESFNYYAEEYDLAAKLMLRGWRVMLDRRFRVDHQKSLSGRDMNVILRRLVRNNGWVARRYAPDAVLSRELSETLRRYRAIAKKENAELGFAIGRTELAWSLRRQERTPMPRDMWDRFSGMTEARASLQSAWTRHHFRTASIIEPGKNARLIELALRELGTALEVDPLNAEALVIGTLSPGPLLDAWDRAITSPDPRSTHERIISPWERLTAPVPIVEASTLCHDIAA